MDGKQPHLVPTRDFKDPFNAGQMVGMLVMLTFTEKNHGIDEEALERIKFVTASNLQEFMDAPTEDVFLLINNIVNEIGSM